MRIYTPEQVVAMVVAWAVARVAAARARVVAMVVAQAVARAAVARARAMVVGAVLRTYTSCSRVGPDHCPGSRQLCKISMYRCWSW